MFRKLTPWTLTILGVVLAAAWFTFPLSERINLGLDLQGGMHLILKVETEKVPPEAREGAARRALEVIRNRIDEFGVKEPQVYPQGIDQIVVQLPGVTDRDRALAIVQRVAHLEFRLVSEDPAALQKALAGEVPAGYELFTGETGERYLVEKEARLTGAALAKAYVDYGQFNTPEIAFVMTGAGSSVFAELTGSNVGRRLAIVLDGKVKSAPVIRSQISDQGVISGSFTQTEASDLALVLRAGALPAPVYIEEERTVGPLLGNDSIQAGVRATAIGFGLVCLFMLGYYLLAGVIANLALALNLLFVLGGLGMFGATLTLPGIAGMVLTLGMAVDANVLIFERMREEVALGRSVRQVIVNGYDKAFTAILDANVTTLIAAGLLFQFGVGPIRGFAVTTFIGLTASMFTALIVTRVVFEGLHRAGWIKRIGMLRLIGETKLDFLKFRKAFFVLSLIAVVGGAAYFQSRGSDAYGIDFTGGQLQQLRFERPMELDTLRSAVAEVDPSASIQKVDPKIGASNEVMIRTAGESVDAVGQKITAAFPDNRFEMVRVEQVGPSIGHDLRRRAVLAIVWAMAAISLYVGFRFRSWAFGIAGILALLHDVLITVGALAITHRPMSLTLVAALLTIAGYSINDTIVIYDRIRELKRTYRKMGFMELINLALNQTLSRTILTTLTTLFAVTALFLWGGLVLNDFAFALLVGLVSGIYSTVFIAVPLLLAWEKKGR
ncbi:MAG: protein translocase subunit SecDF [Candidatus Omnitrophica bacterium CG11_big_fil_rev_8_21_14_0_20_64_10]|nr:MAG: protein translocase subunit SecDF [Candidatus Omnitrophica bacterium CG11_big_fil_rev_8_21_14_0_20_64_10]